MDGSTARRRRRSPVSVGACCAPPSVELHLARIFVPRRTLSPRCDVRNPFPETYEMTRCLALSLFAALIVSVESIYAQEMKEDEAIAEIERLGGRAQLVRRQMERRRRPQALDFGAEPPAPRAEKLQPVVTARLMGTRNFDERVRLLKHIPTLEEVVLDGTATTDGTFAELKPLSHLHRITMAFGFGPKRNTTGGAITDQGMEELQHIRSLTSLELTSDNIGERGVASLATLPNLEHLSLSGRGINDAALLRLGMLRSLKSLSLNAPKMTDAGLAVLARLPAIERLYLAGPCITDAAFPHIARVSKLRSLHLIDAAISDAGLEQLEAGSVFAALTDLSLFGTATSDSSLVHLGCLSDLSTLELGKTRVTDAGMSNLARLEHLAALGLGSTAVTDAGLDALAGLKGLTELNLHLTAVTDKGVEKLKRLPKLQRVVLPDGISDAAVAELRREKINTLGR